MDPDEMMFSDLDEETKQDVFNFLDDLRESGVTNMFGAAPYIQKEFGYSRLTSRKLLNVWMENFGK